MARSRGALVVRLIELPCEPHGRKNLERVSGLEPLTCCLGSNRSTTELYPQVEVIIVARRGSVKAAFLSRGCPSLPETMWLLPSQVGVRL